MAASGQCHAPTALSPETMPSVHCRWSWVGPKGGLNGYGQEKKFLPPTGVQTRTVPPVARSNTDYEMPAEQ